MGYKLTAADYAASLRRCNTCTRAKDPTWFASPSAQRCLICDRKAEHDAAREAARLAAEKLKREKRKAELREQREQREAYRKEREAERREAEERTRLAGETFWENFERERQSVSREEPEEEPMGPLW